MSIGHSARAKVKDDIITITINSQFAAECVLFLKHKGGLMTLKQLNLSTTLPIFNIDNAHNALSNTVLLHIAL